MYISLSITVLPPCVAVHSGSEDVTDVVSMIFRGILMSQFKVAEFQVSGGAVNLDLTHLSFALNSLSFYRRGLFTFILYALLYLVGTLRMFKK